MFFALPNLISSEATPCVPWEFKGLDLIPPAAVANKSERTRWLQNPETRFNCYSAFEGVNPLLRVKGPSGSEEGNPPVSMSALCADYDLPLSDGEIEPAIARMSIKPQWMERTLSGHVRLLWLFEEPISLPSFSFARFLLQEIKNFLPVQHLAGLDEPALVAPEKYWTNGCKWKRISETPVSKGLLKGFLIEISPKFGWDAPEFGPTIPLDVAGAELRKKFPRFSSWPGEFILGAQGPTFWVDGSASPLSATVRATGMQTFAPLPRN